MKTSEHDMMDIQSWVYAHERANPGDIGSKVGNAIMELLALRAVADAAKDLLAMPYTDRRKTLEDALRGAGR